MRDLTVGLLRGRRGPGGVRREDRGLGTVGFGLRGRRGRCEGSRQLLIKGQHGGGLYDLGAIRQSTLGASSWLLGNRDGTQRRQHSWKVSARHHACEENAVTSSSRVSPPGTPSRPRARSPADSTTVSTMSPLARVVPCRQSRRGDSSSRASVAPPASIVIILNR